MFDIIDKILILRHENLWRLFWWRWGPGVAIKVKWPPGGDPNHHYRPEIEEYVGRQGWDWDWGLKGNDINCNRLTIKFRKGKESHAMYFAMKWS